MQIAELIETDALTLAQLIRTKQVSPVAVIDAVLRRIEALQPRVNAFITRDRGRGAGGRSPGRSRGDGG